MPAKIVKKADRRKNAPSSDLIFLVDDDPLNLEMVKYRLSTRGYRVETFSSGKLVLEALKKKQPDIILMDIIMPEISGLEVLANIRQSPLTATIPVIMISALRDTGDVVKGLQMGANDYVTKPINLPILLARLETHLKLGSLVRRLEMQMEVLARLAAIDELTGVYNRRSMTEILNAEYKRCIRYEHHLSALMMDIDHFKQVNDTYGHAAGDVILREFAQHANSSLRSNDTLCRYGGEEFFAILPETDIESAKPTAERIREAIEDSEFISGDQHIHITVSIGVASLSPESGKSPERLVEEADQALYMAKKSGRNRVCIFHENNDAP